MADAQTARPTAETPVGDQCRALAQLWDALDHAGQRQHLAHPRAAAWSLVPHDEHIAGLDLAVDHRVCRRLFAIEDTRRAAKRHLMLVDRTDFDDRPFRR